MLTDIDLAEVPLADHPCHRWLRDWQGQDALAFRACFSEAPDATLARDHVAWSLPYRRSLRDLAALLDCPPTEEAILATRQSLPAPAYLARLFAGAGLGVLLLDDGFPPPAEALTVAEVGAATALPVGRVLRVETLVQDLTAETRDFGEVVDRFDAVAGDVQASGVVALKTIAAYRSGLRLAPVGREDAAREWHAYRRAVLRQGRVRLTGKPLVDFFALRALAHANRQGVPVQVHTGYGDPDLDLREATPLHLRPVLEEPAYRGARVVLLHGAYPYTREAAFLAAVYPQVYLDLSTALPPLGAAELRWMAGVALAVAPASKLLLSSDGARIPEHHVLGARRARWALAGALAGAVEAGEVDRAVAMTLAAWPLWRTAHSIYGSIVPVAAAP
jgi:hypothetical protein